LPPADSDEDGIPDTDDKCPDTPKGAKVDQNGCPIVLEEKITITPVVEFDFDSAELKPLYDEELSKLADLLIAYPGTHLSLEGHTDSVGPTEYNLGLSKRRAESVKRFLVERYDIDPSRISTTGYGETQPADTNASAEGRQRNRRTVAPIEAIIGK
jgi:OOP family OmpA-OmpF porin